MSMNSNADIVVFESSDGEVRLDVSVTSLDESVWLNRQQIAKLYSRDVKTIGKHIGNALKEELSDAGFPTVAKFATVQIEGNRQVERKVEYYSLDVVLSVGYRVKSKRGVEFRRWANGVLKSFILDGYAENKRRMAQLGQIVRVMERVPQQLEADDVLSVVKAYTDALDLLDDYDHQSIEKPVGSGMTYELGYEECRELIDSMRFSTESNLFGVEKDGSFKSSISAIYQSFGGQEIYPSLEEKAANLLYFVVKNHSFLDGNKRIAAALFLYFLDKNNALILQGAKRVSDSTLVALTIMIAESKPEEKEAMVALVMSFLDMGSKELNL